MGEGGGPEDAGVRFAGVGMVSGSDFWIGAGIDGGSAGIAMHWNHRRWTKTPSFGDTGDDVVPDRRGGVWLGDFGHWTGRRWIDPSLAVPMTGVAPTMIVKIPGTAGSYLGSGGVTVSGAPTGDYPGVMRYGPLP